MTVKELRTITGLSQRAFGKKYHIPTRTIEDWEGGRRKPSETILYLLERAVKEDYKMKLFTADRETGTFIEPVESIEEGIALIAKYEEADKSEGTFEDGFYDVVDINHCSKL